MDYKERAENWYKRALDENDEFTKFLLFYVAFEVSVKSKFNKVRGIIQDRLIKDKFYNKIDHEYLKKLKHELDENPLRNMKYSEDSNEYLKLKSIDDFKEIVEFVIIARNNLIHGDKELDDKRDVFIVKEGTRILKPLVEAIIH